MKSTITPMPTRSAIQAEASRQAQTVAAAHDSAAEAVAVMVSGLKHSVLTAIAESRHSLVEEEVMQAFDLGELTRAVLAALMQDGAVVEHQGVYIVPQVAA